MRCANGVSLRMKKAKIGICLFVFLVKEFYLWPDLKRQIETFNSLVVLSTQVKQYAQTTLTRKEKNNLRQKVIRKFIYMKKTTKYYLIILKNNTQKII